MIDLLVDTFFDLISKPKSWTWSRYLKTAALVVTVAAILLSVVVMTLDWWFPVLFRAIAAAA